MSLTFEWDAEKAKANLKKHKISFDEARTIFADPRLLTFPDAEHSEDEDRFISIGLSSKFRVLLTVHAERGEDVIRIISCRRATVNERKVYDENTQDL